VTEGLQRLLDAKGEKLCSGCQRLAPPAGYFVSPAQSCLEKGNIRLSEERSNAAIRN